MRGFDGGSIVEIISHHRVDIRRAVYTVGFAKAIYVLHTFQKKLKRGIATASRDIELIRQSPASSTLQEPIVFSQTDIRVFSARAVLPT